MDKPLSYKAFLRRARQRRERIVSMRRAGMTYQAIGDKLRPTVTRERVRQILKEEGAQ